VNPKKFKSQPKPFHLSLGERGEMVAWNFLARAGYKILEKNYRCKIGEMDVVAEKNGRISFIEIKTRSDLFFGLPEESVHPAKQRKLVQLAKWYLKDKRIENVPVSFEVLAIVWKGKEEPQIRLIENAFDVEER
jgi:putative endonuclease